MSDQEPLWYVEERKNDAWVQCTYLGDAPTERRADGSLRFFRFQPILVPPCYRGMSLYQLAFVLSPFGPMASVDPELVMEFVATFR